LCWEGEVSCLSRRIRPDFFQFEVSAIWDLCVSSLDAFGCPMV